VPASGLAGGVQEGDFLGMKVDLGELGLPAEVAGLLPR
jgi:hypothetical protein